MKSILDNVIEEKVKYDNKYNKMKEHIRIKKLNIFFLICTILFFIFFYLLSINLC